MITLANRAKKLIYPPITKDGSPCNKVGDVDNKGRQVRCVDGVWFGWYEVSNTAFFDTEEESVPIRMKYELLVHVLTDGVLAAVFSLRLDDNNQVSGVEARVRRLCETRPIDTDLAVEMASEIEKVINATPMAKKHWERRVAAMSSNGQEVMLYYTVKAFPATT